MHPSPNVKKLERLMGPNIQREAPLSGPLKGAGIELSVAPAHVATADNAAPPKLAPRGGGPIEVPANSTVLRASTYPSATSLGSLALATSWRAPSEGAAISD